MRENMGIYSGSGLLEELLFTIDGDNKETHRE